MDDVEKKNDEELICYCFEVTKDQIIQAIKKHDITEVTDITWFTRAGAGCGGCGSDLIDILNMYLSKTNQKI